VLREHLVNADLDRRPLAVGSVLTRRERPVFWPLRCMRGSAIRGSFTELRI
jgi:hypothetical protein